MSQTNLSVRVDAQDKKNFERFCTETGMNVSVAVNMFIKAVLREQRLPFEIKSDPFFSEPNMKRLKKAISDVETGKSELKEHDLIYD